jgi:hypothetical protein
VLSPIENHQYKTCYAGSENEYFLDFFRKLLLCVIMHG